MHSTDGSLSRISQKYPLVKFYVYVVLSWSYLKGCTGDVNNGNLDYLGIHSNMGRTGPKETRSVDALKYMYLIQTVLLVSGVLASQPIVLIESTSDIWHDFVVLGDGTVLFIDSDDQLALVNIYDPQETGAFLQDWDPKMYGWRSGRGGTMCRLALSPDGEYVCFVQVVGVPEGYQTEEEYIPGPHMNVVCKADGTGAKPLGLSLLLDGYSADFSFTQDSRHIFGPGTMGCIVTAPDYVSFFTGEDRTLGESGGFMVDIQDGTRSGDYYINEIYLGHGYNNPWSNLTTVGGGEWEDPNYIIADVVTQEVILQDTTCSEHSIVNCWVLPDAGLAEDDHQQILRYSNGTEVINPGEPISVFGRLEDGRYIFSRGGNSDTILLGSIDWTDFSCSDADTLSGLEDFMNPWTRFSATPDGNSLVFYYYSTLYRYDLP